MPAKMFVYSSEVLLPTGVHTFVGSHFFNVAIVSYLGHLTIRDVNRQVCGDLTYGR